METKELSNKSLQKAAEHDAWQKISEDYPLTENMLEKYADKLDWEAVVTNNHIHWTLPMLEKFKDKIDWTYFSSMAESEVLMPKMIEALKDLWDWDALSGNSSILMSPGLLEKYADRWNWKKIINRVFILSPYDHQGIDFYELYKDYIPADKLKDSELWEQIVQQVWDRIVDDIITNG